MAAYFNRALWKRNLTRFWPLAALCFVTAFFVFLAPEIGRYNTSYYTGQSEREILSVLSAYCAAAVPAFSIFTALAVFGYLHNARAAGFISALPITRRGLFITNYLSGLALTLIPHLIIGVIFGLTLIGEPVSFSQYTAWFGIMLGAHLLFYSMAVFCAFLTGNPFMQIFLYALINFLYPLLYVIANVISNLFVYGYYGSLPFWNVLSPPISMLGGLWPHYRDGSIGTAVFIWACYLALAAVLIIGAYALYRRRRIESAGDVILHKPLRPVFKYAMSFLLGVFLGALFIGLTGGFDNSAVQVIVSLAASASFFGALGCLFIEMLMRKRLKVWRTAWKGILCYICTIVALALFIRLDGTGFERRVPDAEDISAVSVTLWNEMDYVLLHEKNGVFDDGNSNNKYIYYSQAWSLSDEYIKRQTDLNFPLINEEMINEIKLRYPEYYESPEGIAAALALHNAIISEKKGLEGTSSGSRVAFVITYKMKNGSAVIRRYYMPRSDEIPFDSINRLLELYNLPEAVNKRNRFQTLPEEELLGALAANVYGRYDISYAYAKDYEVKEYYTEEVNPAVFIGGDELQALTDALRRDAAAGALGRVDWRELTEYDAHMGTSADTNIAVSLCYDSSVIPALFQPGSIYDGEREIYGYILHIPVNRSCVNTRELLVELGLE